MKRQNAEVGVKYWDNQDFLDLQNEPLKALDGFFAQYGPCVVKGCEITTSGSTFDIAPGLVVLTGQDHQEKMTTMIVPFEGVSGTSLPVYLTLQYEARVREYGDGKVKPIAYNYTAKASTVLPQEDVPYLMIQQNGTRYFTDAIQDAKHRFVSDTEKAQWSAKETTEGSQNKAEAALRSAKEYTDSREEVMRTNWAEDDASTLAAAKSYAEHVVAALVDGSPEALNTLQELAAALGNDPNFATTVMNEIGKRATTEAMNAALAGKLDKSGGTMTGNLVLADGVKVSNTSGQNIAAFMAFASTVKRMVYGNINVSMLLLSNGPLKRRTAEPEVDTEYTVWDSGNFNPSNYIGYQWKEDGYNLNDATGFGVYFYNTSTVNRPPDSDFGTVLVYQGGYGNWVVQMATQTTGDMMFVRTKTNDLDWTSWKKMFNSGNLAVATQSANGLMSAADKKKLDGLSVTSKCCGRVSSGGTLVGGFGCSSSTKLSTGKYRVYHNMGHTNYVVTVTIIPGDTNTYDNTPMVSEMSTTYFDVWIGTGAGTLEDTGFFFITMSYN